MGYRIVVVVLVVVSMAVSGCGRRVSEPQEFGTAQEAAEAFMGLLFKEPRQAYALFEEEYKKTSSEEQFLSALRTMLPPAESITNVRFLSLENEYEEANGATLSEYCYEVQASDDFQPRSKVGIHVVESGGKFRIRRFTVSAMPEE